MLELLTQRTSLNSSFFRDMKLPMKTDDVRSGTRDMVPSFPGFSLFLPRERRKRKNPGNEVDHIGAQDVSQFALGDL